MRLIDADKLKENLLGEWYAELNATIFDHVFDLIDNSTTVEERPQGEWIFLKANEEQTDGYECSVCKNTYHTRVPYFSEFNFCPNCGASMQKGGAK